MGKKKKPKAPAAAPAAEPATRVPAPLPAPSENPLSWRFVLGLFAAALLLRVLYLGRAEIWGDEILLVQTADIQMGTSAVIQHYWNQIIVAMAWLPAPAVLLNAYMRAASQYVGDIMTNPLLIRIPGALFGAWSVLAVYWLAKSCTGEKVARLAGVMMCVFLFPVYYSREIHAYPMLLCMAGWTATLWLRALCAAKPQPGVLAALLLCSLLLAYTHLTGAFLLAACAAVCGLWWLLAKTRRTAKVALSASFATGAVLAVALAGVVPVFHKVLFGGNPHLGFHNPISIPTIVNDGVSKMFLGDKPAAALVAWILLIAGCIHLWRRAECPLAARSLVLATALTMLLVTYAAKRTQYLSPRYFAAATPFLFVSFAAGTVQAARWLTRLPRCETRENAFLVALAAIPLLIHGAVYLPTMYQLRAKMAPYGQVAEWLNKNLPAGSPYSFDCGGWDLRYVPGYYATPNLQPVVWVSWNGTDYAPTVQGIQKRMMDLFPVSAYIESVDNAWDVPHHFYRQKVELRNEPLDRLFRLGARGSGSRAKTASRTTGTSGSTPRPMPRRSRARMERR